jgi:DNA polymerase-3 subunit beta
MAKSRLTRTPHKEEVLERTVKKKRSTATAHNSTKTVKKSVKPTTETSSVCEPSTISPQQVEASQTCTNFAALPAVDAPSLETLSNEAILPSPSPLPSAIEVACNSREFNDYIQALKGIIPSNSSHPILSNILIEADAEPQHLHLTAYNLEFGMQVSFGANVNQSGKLTLPAPILADILGKFPNGSLTLKSSCEIIKGSDVPSVSATLSASRSKHAIRGLAAGEFPVIPSVEKKLVTLPASVLIAVLKASLFAVSSEENKRILTGANFQLSRDADRGLDKLRIWTTDGHRVAMVVGLSENNNANPLIDEPVQFTVPAKVLRVLERNLNPTDRIAIYYDGSTQQSSNIVTFQWKNWRLTAQLLEGQYPLCDQIIAPHRHLFSNQLIVEKQALLKALERLASHSDKSHVTVILELDSEFQQVMASINNTISSGNETIDAKISGGNFRIKCDIRYLIDTAKAISSSDLRILMAAPTAPLLIVPFGIPSLGTEALDCEYIVAPQE